MTFESHDPAGAPPPPLQLLQMLTGLWVAQVLGSIARFGFADLLANGQKSSDELARAAATDPSATYRLLRAGAAVGLVVEHAGKEFSMTPVGACLRSDGPGAMRDFVIAETAPGHWLPWGRLHDAVKSGQSIAADVLGSPAWEYYARNPEEALSFARGMGNLSALVAQDAAAAYDASHFERIVDVGGSQGVMLKAFLAQSTTAKGVLFDLPEIVASAADGMAAAGLTERVERAGGSFFESIPADGDLYVLKSILHDWDDEHCATILKNVHSAARLGAKILIVEMTLPDGPQPSPASLMDLNMLVMLGGKERTATEFKELLATAGFEVQRVIPTKGLFSLIEAARI